MDSTDNSEKKQRILLIALSGIGNFIMQSPAISLLREKYPTAHITCWVAPRGTKSLAQNHPAINEVIEMPIKHSILGHIKAITALRKGAYDIGIVLSPGQHSKSAFYMAASGIRKRIGNTYPFFGMKHSGFLLTDSISETLNTHDIEQNIQLLAPLGISMPSTAPLLYSLAISENQKKEAQTFIETQELQRKMLIGFHAGCSPDFMWKRWPLQRFATVAKKLLSLYPTAHILIFGGPDEANQKQELANLIGNDQVTIVDRSLLATAAIMQHLQLLIANDSGLMHLGAASGVPTIGLFGPTDEIQTGPRGTHSYVIRAPETSPVYNTESAYAFGSTPHQSLLAIHEEMVIQKAQTVLSHAA